MSDSVLLYLTPTGILPAVQTITAGRYALRDLLFPNDTLAAMSVPDGWRVTLYVDDNFSGAFKTFYGAAPSAGATPPIIDLSPSGFANKASSLIMEPACVILYVDENYNGARLLLRGPGRYTIADLGSVGNDRVSSLRVPPGWRVTLHQHDDFSGATATYTSDASSVGLFNDQTSSITVEIDKAILYSDPAFLGSSQVFEVGRYPLSALTVGNDTVSSLRVPPGWRVTLFVNDQYSGTSSAYIQDTDTLGPIDNVASSLVVEKLTGPFLPLAGQSYTMTAAHSGLNADVTGGSLTAGASLIQWPATGGKNQLYRFEPATDGFWYIRAVHSGSVLEVQSGATAAGAAIVQAAQLPATSQQWRAEPLGTGYALTARNSRLAMSIANAATTPGTPFTQLAKGSGGQVLLFKANNGPAPTGVSGVPAAPVPVGASGKASSLGTPTGSTSTGRASSPPSALTQLGAVTVSIFFYQFTFPLAFSGNINIDPLSRSTTYSGPAALASPFNISVDPLAVSIALADGTDWVLKFGLPQSASISRIIQDNVLGHLPSPLSSTLQSVVVPFLNLYNNSVVILAKNAGSDADYGSYLGGFNVFTRLNAAQIPPFDKLQQTFPSLGLDSRAIVLGVGASATGQSFFVNAQLLLNVPLVPASPSLVMLKSIGLNVGTQSTSVEVGAQLAFTLQVGGDVLNLDGGLTVSTGSDNTVTIWGALEAPNGAWNNPFGFKGVSIVSLGVEIGVGPVFPFVVIGLRGEVHIGNGLLGGSAAILFDPNDVSKCILSIYSEEGLNLPKLITALTDGKVSAGKLLNVALTKLQLYVAPKGGTIADKTYDPGIAIGGHLDLWGYNATVQGSLVPSSGGSLSGTMDPVHLQANGTSFLDITATDGKSGAAIQVDCSTASLGGHIDAQVTILGSIKLLAKLDLNSTGFTGLLTASAPGLYSSASLTLDSGQFKLSYSAQISAAVNISGYNVPVSVACAIAVTVTSSSFSQRVSFSFSAMGKSFSAGPYTVNIPFRQLADLSTAFANSVATLFTTTLKGYLAEATGAAFDWVKTNVVAEASRVATFFKGVGAANVNIAKGLVNVIGTTAEQAVSYLGVGANEAASLLRNTFNRSIGQVGAYLTDVAGYSEDVTRTALGAAGYAESEISNFFTDYLNPSNW